MVRTHRYARRQRERVHLQAERGPACPSPTGNSSGRMADMTLPALPEESFQRMLCVVAHPDDMEYGTSAAVARWTAPGLALGSPLLTPGQSRIPTPPAPPTT